MIPEQLTPIIGAAKKTKAEYNFERHNICHYFIDTSDTIINKFFVLCKLSAGMHL